jgi:hypothetical protein
MAAIDDLLHLMVRTTDPATSHQAAEAVRPAENDMQREIRKVVSVWGPMSADTIAQYVTVKNPGRWLTSSIVSACNPKRSGLVNCGTTVNDRGRTVILWGLP